MVLRSLLNKAGVKSWPTGIPNLYPDMDGAELCCFLSDAAYKAILRFPQVIIFPFASEDQQEHERLFGTGLARLLQRDLMLVRNISVRGPEDTPALGLEEARKFVKEQRVPSQIHVMGSTRLLENGFTLELEVRQAGQPTKKGTLTHTEFQPFLGKCARNIARSVSGHIDETLQQQWQVARPSEIQSLIHLGYLRLALDEMTAAQKKKEIREALDADPNFGMSGCESDSDDRSQRNMLLEAFRRDPFDAQVCFGLFINVWSSSGWEPAAMQFARRAIELSPGHGKAHMCAPHASHPSVAKNMIRHSELGYRLLPGNPFAINNYILNLQEQGAPRQLLIQLANEGIASDPYDPANYQRMIEMFCEAKDYTSALSFAQRLQALYEPVMNKRALYCLKQNPQRAKLIESGRYDPAEENRKLISNLEQAVNSRYR